MEITASRQQNATEPREFSLGGEINVKRIGFGAMRLGRGTRNGPIRNSETGQEVLRRAIKLGINHIDTADFYGMDAVVPANALIRETLSPYEPGLVIATKVGPIFGPNGPIHASAFELRGLVESNLKSLGVNCLDLVYLRIGMMEPPHGESLAERFEALARMREEGLIRHLGLSNVDLDHICEARAIAPVVAVQNQFNIARREDRAVLDFCAAENIAFVPFGPIGSGITDLGDDRVSKIAARHGATVSQVALAWLLTLSPVTLAIPGTGSIAHLEENVRAGSLTLTVQDLADLA